ncbi:MAG: APC family permease, partial [Nakamurella sp.]
MRGLAFYLGAVLGTGVLALPGLAAQAAGPASLIAWSVLIVASVPIAWTFALLGAKMPDPGGASTYVRKAFGDSAAACCGWVFYFTVPIGVPASAYFAGNYVANAVGGGPGTTVLVTGLIVAAVLLCNVVGIRTSSTAALGVAAVLVLVVVAAVVVAAPHAQLAHLRPFAPHGWSAIGTATALIVWAFAGWEAMSHLGGEFRDPQRDLRRVTAAALVIVGLLYLALAAAVVLVLGPRAGTSVAPLADLLGYGVGGAAGGLSAVVAVILTVGVLNAYVAGASKLGAALGRDGSLPRWFATGAAQGVTPRRSLLVVAGVEAAAFGVLWLNLLPQPNLVLLMP